MSETSAPSPPPCGSPFPYRSWSFIDGEIETPVGSIPRVATTLTFGDTAGHWLMRWGVGRARYRIAPGLYAVGNPGATSPVLVSANYKMSFDVLRRDICGLDAWILVIDTKGINVWCAAGKGTFGTEEIIGRVRQVGLERLVEHRTLVLPQLGAPGVAAHKVREGCGFRVVYGPVRARDLKGFIAAGMTATEEMRRVTFTTIERTILTPVELTSMLKPLFWTALFLFVTGGIGGELFSIDAALSRGGGAFLVCLGGVVAGAVVTPVLLPWIPGRAFSLKGALFGLASAMVASTLQQGVLGPVNTAALLLAFPAVSSYCAMNFTGSTPYTSPSGVEKEMRIAIPLQAAACLGAFVLRMISGF